MAVATQFPTTNAAHGALAQLTNPTNVYADDSNFATGAPGKNTTLANEYGTFGFDAVIPSGATIDKVQLIYGFFVSTSSSIATARVHSLVSGAAQANHDDTTEPNPNEAALKVVTVDITADRTWTRANLLDGVLTVAFEAVQGNSSTAVTFSFDYVKVEVTYHAVFTQTVTGIFAPSGTLAARVNKVLTGVFAATGTLVKTINKTVTGIFAPSGIVTKTINKIIDGIVTFSGTVAGSKVVTQAVGGIVTFAGTVASSKLVSQAVGGVITFGGNVTKTINKALAGTVTFAGNASKVINVVLTGAVTFTGNAGKVIMKNLNGALTFVKSLVGIKKVGGEPELPAEVLLFQKDNKFQVISGADVETLQLSDSYITLTISGNSYRVNPLNSDTKENYLIYQKDGYFMVKIMA